MVVEILAFNDFEDETHYSWFESDRCGTLKNKVDQKETYIHEKNWKGMKSIQKHYPKAKKSIKDDR